MRSLFLLLAACLLAGCAVRTPLMHPTVTRTCEARDRQLVMNKLAELLAAERIGIAAKDIRAGSIVTDSFDVLPEYCDCGLNMIGAQYPGQRRGVMRIRFSNGPIVRITFDLKTRLRIQTNDRLVLCTSLGILEEKLLTGMEKELGAKTTP